MSDEIIPMKAADPAELIKEMGLVTQKDVERMLKALNMTYQKVEALENELKKKQVEQMPHSSAAVGEITKALIKAKSERGELNDTGKGQRGDFYSLEDLKNAYDFPLGENGIDTKFYLIPGATEDDDVICCRMTHFSGEFFATYDKIYNDEATSAIKDYQQRRNAALTYVKRRLYQMLIGL